MTKLDELYHECRGLLETAVECEGYIRYLNHPTWRTLTVTNAWVVRAKQILAEIEAIRFPPEEVTP